MEKDLQIKKPKEGNMCTARTELINRGRMDGMKSGMEQGIEQGIKQGVEQGIKQGMGQGIKALIQICIDFGSTQEETLERIVKYMQHSYDVAGMYMEKYWLP